MKRLRKEAGTKYIHFNSREYRKVNKTGSIINGSPERQMYQALKALALQALAEPPIRKAWPVSLTKLRRAVHNWKPDDRLEKILTTTRPQFPGKL